MAETRYTPTPWRAVLDEDGVNVWARDGEGEHHIANLDVAAHGKFLSSEEMDANAALIVRAVNNHEALVEALAEFIEAFGNRGESTSLHVWDQRLKAARDKARAALASATGGTK